MQTHVSQLTKQRLSDFFVKEDGHVAHKNALVAGAVATGAILASQLLVPNTAEAHWANPHFCQDPFTGVAAHCNHDEMCFTSFGVAECI